VVHRDEVGAHLHGHAHKALAVPQLDDLALLVNHENLGDAACEHPRQCSARRRVREQLQANEGHHTHARVHACVCVCARVCMCEKAQGTVDTLHV
jgi:hypothetical protein